MNKVARVVVLLDAEAVCWLLNDINNSRERRESPTDAALSNLC